MDEDRRNADCTAGMIHRHRRLRRPTPKTSRTCAWARSPLPRRLGPFATGQSHLVAGRRRIGVQRSPRSSRTDRFPGADRRRGLEPSARRGRRTAGRPQQRFRFRASTRRAGGRNGFLRRAATQEHARQPLYPARRRSGARFGDGRAPRSPCRDRYGRSVVRDSGARVRCHVRRARRPPRAVRADPVRSCADRRGRTPHRGDSGRVARRRGRLAPVRGGAPRNRPGVRRVRGGRWTGRRCRDTPGPPGPGIQGRQPAAGARAGTAGSGKTAMAGAGRRGCGVPVRVRGVVPHASARGRRRRRRRLCRESVSSCSRASRGRWATRPPASGGRSSPGSARTGCACRGSRRGCWPCPDGISCSADGTLSAY